MLLPKYVSKLPTSIPNTTPVIEKTMMCHLDYSTSIFLLTQLPLWKKNSQISLFVWLGSHFTVLLVFREYVSKFNFLIIM